MVMTRKLFLATCRHGNLRSMAIMAVLLLLAMTTGTVVQVEPQAKMEALLTTNGMDASTEDRQFEILQQGAEGLGGAAQGRIGHRLRLIFPLILAIAARLGTLVPIGLSVLGAVTLMVMFAQKAFIISLITLGVTLWDKWVHKYRSPPSTFFHHHPLPATHHVDSWDLARWQSPVSPEGDSTLRGSQDDHRAGWRTGGGGWVEGDHLAAPAPDHALLQAQRKPSASYFPFPSQRLSHRELPGAGKRPSGPSGVEAGALASALTGARRMARWPPPLRR